MLKFASGNISEDILFTHTSYLNFSGHHWMAGYSRSGVIYESQAAESFSAETLILMPFQH